MISKRCVRSISSLPLSDGVFLNKICSRTGLMALEKKENILSHPNNNNHSTISKTKASEISLIKNKNIKAYDETNEVYIYSDGSSVIHDDSKSDKLLYVLNRLDSATSGLLLTSFSYSTAEYVKTLFRKRKVTKQYVAVVFGHVPINNKKLVWKNEMGEKSIKMGRKTILRAMSSSMNKKHEEFAVTSVECLKHLRYKINHQIIPLSIVRLSPITGYTHQLRYQCMKHGYPIVGDKTYGNFHMNRVITRISDPSCEGGENGFTINPRLYLHCHRISLDLSAPFDTNAEKNIKPATQAKTWMTKSLNTKGETVVNMKSEVRVFDVISTTLTKMIPSTVCKV